MRKRWFLILAAAALVVGAPIAWWLASPLFFDKAVDEAFPFPVPAASEIEAMSPETAEESYRDIMEGLAAPGIEAAISPAERETISQTLALLSEAMPATLMDEPPAAASDAWQLVSEGNFRDADSFHQGSGRAAIYQLGEQRVLRFEEFEVTNGPDLHVLLVENVDAANQSGMGESLDLGPLKGNIGSQNYPIPDGVDLSRYSGVMIYCVPFHVVFATDPLGTP